MATYDHLPVYKKTYDLLLQLFRLSQNMERDYRYTIGENLKKEVIELQANEHIEDISRQLAFWQRSHTQKTQDLFSQGESRTGQLAFSESAG